MSNEIVVGAFVAAMAAIVAWNLWSRRKGARKPARDGAAAAGTTAAVAAGPPGGDAANGACSPGADSSCASSDGP
jgi:hypothetical protein